MGAVWKRRWKGEGKPKGGRGGRREKRDRGWVGGERNGKVGGRVGVNLRKRGAR